MDDHLRLPLTPTADQLARLNALQHAFAQACNVLAPVAQQTRCWNRVGLHHLAYRQLRQRFPELGSQMVCNAIYSVSRACRHVYQHPQSPHCIARNGQGVLPRLQFLPHAPVYFDRHTLSIKAGQVSMFTLDGRMRFQLDLTPADEQRFRDGRLREIVLSNKQGRYTLNFHFAPAGDNDTLVASEASAVPTELPEYVLVIEDEPLPVPRPPVAAPAQNPT